MRGLPGRGDQRQRGIQPAIAAAVKARHPRPAFRQPQRHSLPDARARAGDEGDLARQIEKEIGGFGHGRAFLNAVTYRQKLAVKGKG